MEHNNDGARYSARACTIKKQNIKKQNCCDVEVNTVNAITQEKDVRCSTVRDSREKYRTVVLVHQQRKRVCG